MIPNNSKVTATCGTMQLHPMVREKSFIERKEAKHCFEQATGNTDMLSKSTNLSMVITSIMKKHDVETMGDLKLLWDEMLKRFNYLQ